MYLPNIGGIVNADAIAIISLMKNKLSADQGNLRAYPCPSLWVSALSFSKDNDVLTKNTEISFEIAGSTHGITIWSAKFEVT
jgi:hypothetical protein